MDWQITLYTIGLTLTTLVSMSAAVIALRHHERPGATALGLSLLAVAEWAGCYVIEANAITIPLKILWSQLAYIGTVTAGPLLLYFTIRITQKDRLLSSSVVPLIWVVPIITLLLAFTNDQHGLVWSDLVFAEPSHHILIYEHGLWLWVLVVHVYTILIFTSVLLVQMVQRMRHIYRRQSLIILLSVISPWSINAVYLFLPRVLGYRDWTPLGFAASGLLLFWAFSELQLLDLMPVARDLIVENILDGVLVVDALGRIVDANAAAQQLIRAGDVVGKQATRVFAELTKRPTVAKLTPDRKTDNDFAITGSTSSSGDLTTADGRTLAWTSTPLKKQRRHLTGHIILLRDITQQRAAEAALQQINTTLEAQVSARTAEIREAQERSTAILCNINDGIMMTDHDFTIQYTNPALTKITGFTHKQMVGVQIQPSMHSTVHQQLSNARATGRTWQGAVSIQQAEGRTTDIAATIVPVHDDMGTVTGFVCTAQDISRLVNLVRTRKGILDNISHQLRTPVTALRLYTHLLKRTELTSQQEHSLSVIEDQINWLQHMIEDILEMTALDSGEATGVWTKVYVANLVELLLARWRPQATQAGLEITVDIPTDEDLAVRGDEARLIQALGEIVNNALLFTPADGKITLAVRPGRIDQQPAIALSIADTGIGIPADEQPRVFDRFFRGQATSSGQLPGTGLGLCIAAKIIDAHGGHIALDSNSDGSVFTIWLPAA